MFLLFSGFSSQGRRYGIGDSAEDIVDKQTSRKSYEIVDAFHFIGQIFQVYLKERHG